VEINTDGYNHPVQDIYPSFDIIRKCREHGISITLGSDAHMPANVGQHYEKVLPLLIEAGYSHLTVFDRRKRSQVSITNT
jgi:histidinol-phosphatase (PHP family)